MEFVQINGKRLHVSLEGAVEVRNVRARLSAMLDTPCQECTVLYTSAGEALEDSRLLTDLDPCGCLTVVVTQDPAEDEIARRHGEDSFKDLIDSAPRQLNVAFYGPFVQGAHWPLTRLPRRIGLLDSLTDLNVSRNILTSLPDSICTLVALTELNVYHNKLNSLPSNIGDMASLATLQACENVITSLPASFGRLNSLTFVGLGANAMTTLPDVFSSLSSLCTLNADQRPPSLPVSFDDWVDLRFDAVENGFDAPSGTIFMFRRQAQG